LLTIGVFDNLRKKPLKITYNNLTSKGFEDPLACGSGTNGSVFYNLPDFLSA
jgi:hypothetical protein